jgi:phosphoribosyl 1,2-cyclic phosphodiesterase
MSLFISSLNSGSNGNCYYIGNQDEAVLVDVGISCRETEKRMKRLGLSIKKVKAIFVTHEHGDHIHGVPALSKKHQIPVYITDRTLQNTSADIKAHLISGFRAYQPIQVGGLTITGFPKYHDAADPHSFLVSNEHVTIGIFTDMGRSCEHLIRHFKQCHAAFLESNYDEEMLEFGRYPLALKNRIRNGNGHLSNKQALELFLTHRPSFLNHLFLSHLSKDNNSPKLVRDLFQQVAGTTKIIIASRDKESPLYHIRSTPGPMRRPIRSFAKSSQFQLSLFQ